MLITCTCDKHLLHVHVCTCSHAGVFIARGREDALVTKNIVPGETVYGEKKVSVEAVSSS